MNRSEKLFALFVILGVTIGAGLGIAGGILVSKDLEIAINTPPAPQPKDGEEVHEVRMPAICLLFPSVFKHVAEHATSIHSP